MGFLVLLARLFFSAIFIISSPKHFTEAMIAYGASHGVPMPHLLVPLAGIIALLGGLSILLGYKARLGAWLIVIFLVPVTLMMHNFWDLSGAQEIQLQQIMFFKNVSMLGGALFIAYFGSGPFSLKS